MRRGGYYTLTRPKEHAAEWGWLVDHTDQGGTHPCWRMVGRRLSAVPAPGPGLRHEDGEPLGLEPVRKSTGEIVYQQVEAPGKQTGVPRQSMSAQGGAVKAGGAQCCAAHPAPGAIYASTPKTAALWKHALERAPAWQEFTQWCHQTKDFETKPLEEFCKCLSD